MPPELVSRNPVTRTNPYAWPFDAPCFPRSAAYRSWLVPEAVGLRERGGARSVFPYSERHLQCVWYDPVLRPARLQTRDGEQVTVEQAGIWNQEAGPDFMGAVVRIGPDRRRVAGDVEVHIHPADWDAHGHGHDPRYRQVRFHVTYFPGPPAAVPVPGAVQLALRDLLQQQPGFSFEQVDVAAYPYAARADMPPCSRVLTRFTPEERQAVLYAAGEERLQRKAARLRQRMDEQDAEQALYEEVLTALGYKHNKAAGRYLAQCLPLEELRAVSGGEVQAAYALLLGVAGLLPDAARRYHDPEVARWVRGLWDHWWRPRARYETRRPRPEWRLSGVRPANHPARRLMAAARMFVAEPRFSTFIQTAATHQPTHWVKLVLAYLTELSDEYLTPRLSLTGRPRDQAVALVGSTRAAAMLTNAAIPWLAATGGYDGAVRHALEALPPEGDNGIVKQTAFYLFGRDHAPRLYRSALARQGLLQIFQDFCLNDRSRCERCTFPAALGRMKD